MTDVSLQPHAVPPPVAERQHLSLGMGLLTSLILACAYGFTLAPSITAGDAGELITTCYEFGVPHAPGYPLYTMLGWVMTHLPIGPDPAFRLNLFSMLCSIGACMTAYVLLVKRQLHPIFAGVIALGIGAGPTLWASSVVAEVYGLNLLMLALFWLFLDADLRTGQYRIATWLIGGLTLTTHQTSLLSLIPALAITSSTWPRATRQKRLLQTIGLILAPCLLYLQTLISSQNPNVLAWGHPDTFASWLRFTLLPASQQVSDGTIFGHISYLLELLFGDVWGNIAGISGHPAEMGLAIILALAGLIAVFTRKAEAEQKDDPGPLIWAWASVVYPAIFLLLTKPSEMSLAKLDPYYLPVWFTLWLLVPEGYRALLASQAGSPSRKHLGPILKPILELIIVLGVLITGGASAVANNRGDDTLVRDSYTAMLTSAPQNAILLCDMDDLFVCWYLQRVEKMRPDVVLVNAYFPLSHQDDYWAGWIYDDLAAAHPDLAVDRVEPGSIPVEDRPYVLQEQVRNYVRKHLGSRAILMSFHDPGYLEPLYPPFDFRSLGAGWFPQHLTWRAVTADREQSTTILLAVGKFYLRGEDGVSEYAKWSAKYGRSYEQSYLLARYMTGITSTAQLLGQLGEGPTALALYRRAIALDPSRFDHYLRGVELAESLEQFEVAIGMQEDFVEQIELFLRAGMSPLEPLWLNEATHLARLQLTVGNPQGAALLVAEVLRIDPSYAQARILQQELHDPTGTAAPNTP